MGLIRLVKPSFQILTHIDSNILKRLELCARTCYKSEDLITDVSAEKLIRHIINRGHHSVLEHESVQVRFISNRGFTHELVRHRLAAFSQESTRYCNYSKDKFENAITFVIPPHLLCDIEGVLSLDTFEKHFGAIKDQDRPWYEALFAASEAYNKLIVFGWKPEEARGVLPIDVKAEIVITANLREWRHIFTVRTSKVAHPMMRSLMVPLLREFQEDIPVIFDDLLVK